MKEEEQPMTLSEVATTVIVLVALWYLACGILMEGLILCFGEVMDSFLVFFLVQEFATLMFERFVFPLRMCRLEGYVEDLLLPHVAPTEMATLERSTSRAKKKRKEPNAKMRTNPKVKTNPKFKIRKLKRRERTHPPQVRPRTMRLAHYRTPIKIHPQMQVQDDIGSPHPPAPLISDPSVQAVHGLFSPIK